MWHHPPEHIGVLHASTPHQEIEWVWHFCMNYWALNDRTMKDKFPIPVVEELLNELRGSRFFIKLDLHSRYHQVLMHPGDITKTAFQTYQGLFEFSVMSFDLTNTPATFQALIWRCCNSYCVASCWSSSTTSSSTTARGQNTSSTCSSSSPRSSSSS
jgi:hypothetical protein